MANSDSLPASGCKPEIGVRGQQLAADSQQPSQKKQAPVSRGLLLSVSFPTSDFPPKPPVGFLSSTTIMPAMPKRCKSTMVTMVLMASFGMS